MPAAKPAFGPIHWPTASRLADRRPPAAWPTYWYFVWLPFSTEAAINHPEFEPDGGTPMNQIRFPSFAMFFVVAGLWMPAAHAQSPDDLAAGLRLFTQKGDCGACHGWAGGG